MDNLVQDDISLYDGYSTRSSTPAQDAFSSSPSLYLPNGGTRSGFRTSAAEEYAASEPYSPHPFRYNNSYSGSLTALLSLAPSPGCTLHTQRIQALERHCDSLAQENLVLNAENRTLNSAYNLLVTKVGPAASASNSIGANPHATTATRHAPGLNPAPKHYRTTASPPPPPPRRPPPAAASRQRALPNPNPCTPASAAAPSPHIAHYATPFCLRTAALYCAPHDTTCRTLRTLRTLQPSYNHLHYSFNASGCLSSFVATPPPSRPPPTSLSTGPLPTAQMHSRVLPTPSHSAAFTLGNNCARCALFRHPPFPLDLWATRWLHPSTKPYRPPADTVKHPTTSNFDPPVLAVPPIARHSTAAVVSLATARFAVSYRRGGSNLMGDIYSTEGSDFWGLRGPNSSSFRSILAPISHPALTRHPLAYGAPLAAPLAALQTARCGAFSPMMSPTVTRRSYTPTDSIFEFLDLENGGPLTHASHWPPRSHRYPWTPSRKRILPYHDVQRRWQPRDVSYITPPSLASSQTRTRCGSMPFFPSPFRQQASIAAPDTNRSHGTVLA
ncbi:hypothetical protein C8J57DRAFT_1737415 [Mycena rebaudengoi]|nr:hypothetical protein C8J57DRAFT_1737415 [Mycena rebaudengoi]